MSNALTADEMLARLAARDLAAAERVHDKLMAAEAAPEIADLGRTYQRLARSLRQTLALKAKLAREAEQHARWLARRDPPPFDLDAFDLELDDDDDGLAIDNRVGDLQDAVGRIIHARYGDGAQAREAHDRFDRELDDWIEADDFTEADLDAQVVRAAQFLDIPEDIARGWRIFKRPATAPDPATRPRATRPYPLPRRRRDSG